MNQIKLYDWDNLNEEEIKEVEKLAKKMKDLSEYHIVSAYKYLKEANKIEDLIKKTRTKK